MTNERAQGLEISSLQRAFSAGTREPEQVLRAAYERLARLEAQPIFIETVPLEMALAALATQTSRRAAGQELPLFGVPFAVKDNFDVMGLRTTAGCPAFAYQPAGTAFSVQRLLDAGAILLGKTNLDQFATGLVGVRSPYGACRSALDERYVAGGSSSGSALAVAHGLASFALGTDTAGSGRVPAAFNNIVGLKPTRGLVSTSGVVPACRSLDCVSVFAGSVRDSWLVLSLMAGLNAADAFSRPAPAGALSNPFARAAPATFRFGVPRALEFFDNAEYRAAFAEIADRLETFGGRRVPIDLEPLLEAGSLLYGGPWVAERYAAVGAFIEAHPRETHDVVRSIILAGREPSAHQLFQAEYRLTELRRRVEPTWEQVDVLLLPTTGTVYTVEQVVADPIALNANLGRYTNFVNLLDMAAIALPGALTSSGLPFGITLLGPAFSEARLLAIAERIQRTLDLPIGATGLRLEPLPELGSGSPTSERKALGAREGELLLAVAGAHLSGMPLNHELVGRKATLVRKSRTSAEYELYALSGTSPPKPGLVRKPGFAGPGIVVELWSLTPEAFGSFVQGVPAPMVIGTVVLEDGSSVKSFLCEPYALHGSRNITPYGGWREFMLAPA